MPLTVSSEMPRRAPLPLVSSMVSRRKEGEMKLGMEVALSLRRLSPGKRATAAASCKDTEDTVSSPELVAHGKGQGATGSMGHPGGVHTALVATL